MKMPVCKKCLRIFKKITPTHVKTHGFNSVAEYEEGTADIELPADIVEKDRVLTEKLTAERSKKMKDSIAKANGVDVSIELEKPKSTSLQDAILKSFMTKIGHGE